MMLARVLLLLLVVGLVGAEIHRAKPAKPWKSSHKSGRQEPGPPPSVKHYSRETWILSLLSAGLVGLSGIFPLLVIPIEAGKALRKGAAAGRLKLLLSFAVGGLLGDVFLHLLPEAWKHVEKTGGHGGHMKIGLWVLGGLLAFLIVEKIFPDGNNDDEEDQEGEEEDTPASSKDAQETSKDKASSTRQRKNVKQNGTVMKTEHVNGHSNGSVKPIANGTSPLANGAGTYQNGLTSPHIQTTQKSPDASAGNIKTSGYLNLLANVIDNFTHGLAVGGSYCAGTKSGILTTIIILLHEIPHEIGDFAILLRSGFDRWKAAKAQLLTASGGLLGALTALGAESASAAGDSTAWILPFTSGGFIYIALVTVVPDLLKERNAWESLKQVVLICCGIGAMAFVALWLDEHDLPDLEWLIGS